MVILKNSPREKTLSVRVFVSKRGKKNEQTKLKKKQANQKKIGPLLCAKTIIFELGFFMSASRPRSFLVRPPRVWVRLVMSTRPFLSLLLSLFFLASLVSCLLSSSPRIIPEPPTFTFSDDNEGKLFFDPQEIIIDGLGEITTRAYKDGNNAKSLATIPGPTIRMTRGNFYKIKLVNNLSPTTHDPTHNVLKDANITNLHTHGLHVSGSGNSDNVLRMVNGGECADYEYKLFLDHMGGTHWYHPHHHGSTFLHVGAGAAGALIVEDDPEKDGIPDTVTAMKERIVMVQYLQPGLDGLSGDELIESSFQDDVYLVNGVYDGTFKVPRNTWEHIRFLHVNSQEALSNIMIEGECEVQLMSRDGMWRREVPSTDSNTIALTAASRADFGLRCTGEGSIVIQPLDSGKAEPVKVAEIVIDDEMPTSDFPSPFDTDGNTWKPNFPEYLRDIREDPLADEDTQIITMGFGTINGKKWNPDEPIATFQSGPIDEETGETKGLVYQWQVVTAERHPLHLHMFPMQIKQEGGCGNGFEEGEYYDSYAGERCLVRFKTTALAGMVIVHCHILIHEDFGMMRYAIVEGDGYVAPGDGLSYPCEN